jgi:predicted transposase YdaD
VSYPASLQVKPSTPSEPVADFHRNQWPISIGISGRFSPEYAVEAAYEMPLILPWVKRVYLEEALQEPTPTRGMRVLGLLLAEPAAVVAEAQALLAEPAVDGAPHGPALVDWVETLLVHKLSRLSREEIRKMLNVLNVELKETRFYQEVFAEGQREERLRIAQSLLDVIANDRLLAEKTGLSEAEVQALRAQHH